ncbi:MAG: ATP-binding protein [Bryobacteraceae bacterium]|jgi:signal transduction histidine kinase
MLRPSQFLARCFRLVQPRDFVWLALFGVLIAWPQIGDAQEIVFLVALGVAQVLEPKIPAEPTTRSRLLWIVIKLALGFMLIGYTYSINSVYWPVLLLPVVSAATMFGVIGTTLCAAVAGAAYLVFLHWVPEPSEVIADTIPRLVLLAIIGTLAASVAEDLRSQTRKSRAAAEQLAAANLQLQQAEEEKRRADRLAALGQLSAGLAHELRNPLGTIRASSEMLTQSLAAENEVAREMAGFIASEVDRCNSLITRFLQFARPLELQLAQADLAQTLDRAVALAEREAPAIAFYRNYEPGIPPFAFDAELLERVFYNLLINAAQASPPGGAVTVKTRAAFANAEVSVIDRGCGIDPAQRDNIFNPFFTTKPQGVGLGLAIVSKIVDEHGGNITVESEPGKGSVFRVILPMEVRTA